MFALLTKPVTYLLRLLWIWFKSVFRVKKYVFDLMINHGATAQSEDFRSTMVRQRNQKTFAQPWCDSTIRKLSLNHGATAQSEDLRSTMVRQRNQKTFAQPWCDSAIGRLSLNHGATAQSEDFHDKDTE